MTVWAQQSQAFSPTFPLSTGKTGRVAAFDSLRGIAALIVVIHHLALSFSLPEGSTLSWALDHTPLQLLTAGRASVLLFFVLSGFALAALLQSKPAYPSFVMRRICRIMMPFWVAILASATLYLTLHPAPVEAVSDWMNAAMWSQPVTWQNLARHLLMTGLAKDTFLSGIMWSLVYEMRISLLFPILFLLCKNFPRAMFAASLAVFTALSLYVLRFNIPVYSTDTALQSLILTFYYMPFFVFGCLLHQYRDIIRQKAETLPAGTAVLATCAIYMLLTSQQDGFIGLGAVLLLALILAAPTLAKALMWAPLVWLGKISFSLYLTHLLVMASLFHFLNGIASPIILAALALPLSLLAAHGFHLLVEAPSTQLGRLWSGHRRASTQWRFNEGKYDASQANRML